MNVKTADNACPEKEMILVKLLYDFLPKTEFLSFKEPPNTKVDGTEQANIHLMTLVCQSTINKQLDLL